MFHLITNRVESSDAIVVTFLWDAKKLIDNMHNGNRTFVYMARLFKSSNIHSQNERSDFLVTKQGS